MLFFISALLLSSVSCLDPVKLACYANKARAAKGLGLLSVDPKLTAAADEQAKHVAQQQQMTHTGPGGTQPQDRVGRHGYDWQCVAENVAYGKDTEEAVINQWIASPLHAINLFNPKYVEVGSASSVSGDQYRSIYAVQVYGKDSSGKAKSSPPDCSNIGVQSGGSGDSYNTQEPATSGGESSGDDQPPKNDGGSYQPFQRGDDADTTMAKIQQHRKQRRLPAVTQQVRGRINPFAHQVAQRTQQQYGKVKSKGHKVKNRVKNVFSHGPQRAVRPMY